MHITASPAAQTVTLTSYQALQNVSVPIELRLYGWRDSTGTTTFRFRDNAGSDLSIAGSVSAIPEPSTYAGILGIAGLSAAVLGRRRKRSRMPQPEMASTEA